MCWCASTLPPLRTLPAPALNKVSPLNSAGCSVWASRQMWHIVWPGVSMHSSSTVLPTLITSPALTPRSTPGMRTPGQPKRYVQDLMKERAADLALLLADPNAHFYVCGLKAMEEGVLLAMREVAEDAELSWAEIGPTLKREGRLHLETY